MAGCPKLEDNSCMQQCNETLKSKEFMLQTYFVEMISGFLKGCFGNDCTRPFPPRLETGNSVDLLKLYYVVKYNGGFDAISEKNLWGEVGLQCGLDSSFGSAFKLVYMKYLSSLESWLKLDEENTLEKRMLLELEKDLAAYVSKIVNVNCGSDDSSSFKLEKSGISVIDLTDEDDENESEKIDCKTFVMDFADSECFSEGNYETMESKQHDVKMCFTDVSVERNGESTESKQHNNVMDCASGLLEENYVVEMKSIDGISSERSDDMMFSASPDVAAKSVASKKCAIGNGEERMDNVDYGASKEVLSHKRKRNCISGMLQWMFNVAKDPTDAGIGEIPHCSKRGFYGNDNKWKQALLARECVFEKRNRRRCAPQFGRQKKQKIHSPMSYHCKNLSTSTSYHNEANQLPPRQQLESRLDTQLFEARLDSQPTPSIHTIRPRRQEEISVGSAHVPEVPEVSKSASHQNEANPIPPREQLKAGLESHPTPSIHTNHPRGQQKKSVRRAEVPEWTGVAIKSDPKWLGTRTWPLENTKNPYFFERDPIGKGRMTDCGCHIPGSIECVKFHVSKSRMKIRLELRSAFYAWKFDKMGEDCSASWTIEEEKKFKRLVRENPKSSQRCLWEPMCQALPQKRWVDQVNYYYNVFMLRRRGYQNRHYPSDIDSDDDETEYRSTNNSIRHGTA